MKREKEMGRKGEVGDGRGMKGITYVAMVTMQLE